MQPLGDDVPLRAGMSVIIELEKPALDRAFGEGGVEVEHMVSAAVVMLVSAVVAAL